ncbi:MAG: preprotein translocase subunit YajC [Alphaproteobacteria bacterium]|jgi:preprotein translocase subunit YajC|nr:preprotein translocase subunit YajC [Alphaproteobacteria bacterium]
MSGFDPMAFLPFVLIFGVFYFLILRPQQQKMKKHQNMLNSLRRGDRVVTNGGLIATVTKIVSDGEIQLEIADDIRVRHVRGMIAEVLAKTDPVTPSASSPSQTSSPIVRKLESSKSKGSNKSAANRSKGKAKK